MTGEAWWLERTYFGQQWATAFVSRLLPELGYWFEPMAAEIEQHKKDLRGKSPEEIRRQSQDQKQGDSDQLVAWLSALWDRI